MPSCHSLFSEMSPANEQANYYERHILHSKQNKTKQNHYACVAFLYLHDEKGMKKGDEGIKMTSSVQET